MKKKLSLHKGLDFLSYLLYLNFIYLYRNKLYKYCTFGIFSSFQEEPDTSLIIQFLLLEGKKVALPVINKEKKDMSFSYFTKQSTLVKDFYGILKPSVINEANPDIVIIPLTAFDSCGNRLGKGQGYYDKYLSNVSIHRCGLCYSFQKVKSIPTEKHDIPLNSVITNKEIILFT